MKFDDVFNNIAILDEIDDMLNTYNYRKCCVCGHTTNWFDITIDKPVCSEECRKVINPNAKS